MSSDKTECACYIFDEKSDEIKMKVVIPNSPSSTLSVQSVKPSPTKTIKDDQDEQFNIKAEAPNSSSSTCTDQSQAPSMYMLAKTQRGDRYAEQNKELLDRIDEAHRIIREFRKKPYKELSRRDKIKYGFAKQATRTLPDLLPVPGMRKSNPVSRRNRARPRIRCRRGKTPDRIRASDKVSASRTAHLAFTKQYEEDLKRYSEHLSREEYKQLPVTKLENASTRDKVRVDLAKKSNTTLSSCTSKREDEKKETPGRWEAPCRNTLEMPSTSTKESVASSSDTQCSNFFIKIETDSDTDTADTESVNYSPEKAKSEQGLCMNSDNYRFQNKVNNLKRSVDSFSEKDNQLESAKKKLAMVAKQNQSTDVSSADINWIHSKEVQKQRFSRWDTVATSSNSFSSDVTTSHSPAMPKNTTTRPTISVADFAKVTNEENFLQDPVVDGNTQIQDENEELVVDVENEESPGIITVEEHLQVAIVDGCNPGKQLDAEQWGYIERKLLFCLDETLLRTPGPYPIFDQMTSFKGHQILACCNEFTLQWLKGKITELAPPWVGARLNVVTKKELPTGPLVKINLPGPPICKKRLEQFIRNLNPEFPSQDWKVIQIKDNITDNGQEAIIMFNKESMAMLPDRGYTIRVGISVVTVDPLDPAFRRPAAEKVALTARDNDSDVESTKSECWDSPTE